MDSDQFALKVSDAICELAKIGDGAAFVNITCMRNRQITSFTGIQTANDSNPDMLKDYTSTMIFAMNILCKFTPDMFSKFFEFVALHKDLAFINAYIEAYEKTHASRQQLCDYKLPTLEEIKAAVESEESINKLIQEAGGIIIEGDKDNPEIN